MRERRTHRRTWELLPWALLFGNLLVTRAMLHYVILRSDARTGLVQAVAEAPDTTRPMDAPERSAVRERPVACGNVNIEALIYTESGGDAAAVADRGLSKGVCQMGRAAWADAMQFLEENWDYDKNVFDYNMNKVAAHAYINGVIPKYLKAWGLPDSVEMRLAAYKSSHARLRKNYRENGQEWLTFAPTIVQRDVGKYWNVLDSTP